ncbi:MAG: hypothetical protein HYZ37_16245, partial [Candidatus Solibacter usitatus]|nr:hypothetical protein [Candidatus Solibacter usitatus]
QPVMGHSTPVWLDWPGRPAPSAESAKLFLEQLDFLERWADNEAKFPTAENKAEAMRHIATARKIYQEKAYIK